MYTLTLTKEQATVVEQACELLARCSMGQFDHILWGVYTVAEKPMPEYADARAGLEYASRKLFGNGTGIANCGAQGKRAWDLYQVVRYQLAHDTREDDGTVKFREFMNTAGEAPATITQTE